MLYEVLVIALAIFNLVRADASQHGNLSNILQPTSTIFATTTTTTTSGLGGYILAGLGQKDVYTNSTTLGGTGTSPYSSQASTAPLVCYGMNGKCWNDVFYTKPNIASTGSGSAYATQCSNALSAYTSASNSWTQKHTSVDTNTQVYGGTTLIPITYYANASTLCDGHARVTQSPAVVISTTTIATVLTSPSTSTYKGTVGWEFPVSSFTCSINPSDCDGLWQAYSTSSSKWAAANAAVNATGAADAVFPTMTPSPSMPPCMNASAVSSDAAFQSTFYGCGPCTIFGNEVQLIYFPEPTTVSRDMCATTPSAKLTNYAAGVGVPYTGADPSSTWKGFNTSLELATLNGKTFTSGTAYISIKTVWAEDRCSSTLGTKVTDAILALPSSALLSLRYSQDHFQYFMTTNTQTGYPFNFADLNTPVPYSAWNGQQMCAFPDSPVCDVIYENQYRPNLAMPPGIRKFNPEWERCQMWYGGLYDPPYALKPGTAVAVPTVPFLKPESTSAAPSSSMAAATPTPTALADQNGDQSGSTNNGQNSNTGSQSGNANAGSQGGDTGSQNSQDGDNNAGSENSNTDDGEAQGTGSRVTGSSDEGNNNDGGNQNSQAGGSNAQQDNQDSNDSAGGGQSEASGSTESSNDAAGSDGSANSHVFVFTAGTSTYTATSISTAIVCGSNTISVGGPAATLAGGYVISAGANGLVLSNSPMTLAVSTHTAAAGSQNAGSQGVVTFKAGNEIVTASRPAGKSGVAVIGSVTVSAGGPEQTLAGGAKVSLAQGDAVLVDGTSATAVPAASGADETYTVNGTPLTVHADAAATDGNNAVTIEGSVISRGGSAATLSNGLVVSLASSGLVAQQGASTIPPASFTSASATSSRATSRSSITQQAAQTTRGSNANSAASATSTSKAAAVKASSQRSLLVLVTMFSPLLLAIYL